SPQSQLLGGGPNSEITYTVDLHNLETSPVSGLQLALTATTGLTYQRIDPACPSCSGGATIWSVAVPAIAPHATQRITVTGRLASPLATPVVTSTFDLTLPALAPVGGSAVARSSIAHRVDNQAPTAVVFRLPGQVLGPGTRVLDGSSSDGSGGGVAAVELAIG